MTVDEPEEKDAKREHEFILLVWFTSTNWQVRL
jgi:hypothetical protein